MNKKGIELSVNFLVIIIISLAVFAMGIVFVNKIFFSAAEKVAQMDLQTKDELARLLDQGDKVAMPFFQKTVIHGKTATFGIGVLNMFGLSKFATGKDDNFKIIVEFDAAYDKNDDDICTSSPCDPDGSRTSGDGWLAYDKSEHKIEMNEQGAYTIAINPPRAADTGVYIFNAAVCYMPATQPDCSGEDPYSTATKVCGSTETSDDCNTAGTWSGTGLFGYYNLQKIWLSVK